MKKLLHSKFFWLVLLALGGGITYSRISANQTRKIRLNQSSTTVELGDIVQRSTISGTVTPLRKTIITAPYQGYVQKVFVKLGQNVKVGDPIASVATTLVAGDTAFPLRAPFSGKVVQLNKSQGEFVKAADSVDFIARLDDMSKMFVDCNVPELDRVRMDVGLEAIIKASAIIDRTYKGVISDLTFAARDQDRYGRTAVEFPMRLEVLNFDEQLKPGMSVLVDIITQKKENVMRLRHEFIGREKDFYFVTLANGKTQKVGLGLQNEEFAEITGDIQPGTSVRKVDFSKAQDSR